MCVATNFQFFKLNCPKDLSAFFSIYSRPVNFIKKVPVFQLFWKREPYPLLTDKSFYY